MRRRSPMCSSGDGVVDNADAGLRAYRQVWSYLAYEQGDDWCYPGVVEQRGTIALQLTYEDTASYYG